MHHRLSTIVLLAIHAAAAPGSIAVSQGAETGADVTLPPRQYPAPKDNTRPRPTAEHPLRPTLVSTAATPPVNSVDEALAQPVHASSWEHYQALKARARPAMNPLPDWSGVWLSDFPRIWEPGYDRRDAMPVKLKPKYAAQYRKVLEDQARGIEWDQLSDCLPTGYPRMLEGAHPYEFVVTPKQVWVMTALQNETHRIYTDGRGHINPDDAYPLWGGDAIGFWDGDTLVVHTTNVKAMEKSYQRSGIAQSEQASTVEQWRLIGPDEMVLQITVYDPEVLDGPWKPAPRTWYRAKHGPDFRVEYYACTESSRVVRTPEGGTQQVLFGEPGYIDPKKAGSSEAAP